MIELEEAKKRLGKCQVDADISEAIDVVLTYNDYLSKVIVIQNERQIEYQKTIDILQRQLNLMKEFNSNT